MNPIVAHKREPSVNPKGLIKLPMTWLGVHMLQPRE